MSDRGQGGAFGRALTLPASGGTGSPPTVPMTPASPHLPAIATHALAAHTSAALSFAPPSLASLSSPASSLSVSHGSAPMQPSTPSPVHPARLAAATDPFPAEMEAHAQFGHRVVQRGSVSSQNWRERASPQPYGGVGEDEHFATRLAKAQLNAYNRSGASPADKRAAALSLSRARSHTDVGVWLDPDSPRGSPRYGGHPGALHTPKQVQTRRGSVTHGHGRLDKARGKAATTELGAAGKRTPDDFERAALRGTVETARTMSTPYEQFKAIGPSAQPVFHSRFGDMSKSDVHESVASYGGDSRERLKWDAGAQLMRHNMPGHVSPVMTDYLSAHGGDAMLAMHMYQHDLSAGRSGLSVNTAPTSQAGVLSLTETLRGTATAAALGQRAPALSPPRLLRSYSTGSVSSHGMATTPATSPSPAPPSLPAVSTLGSTSTASLHSASMLPPPPRLPRPAQLTGQGSMTGAGMPSFGLPPSAATHAHSHATLPSRTSPAARHDSGGGFASMPMSRSPSPQPLFPPSSGSSPPRPSAPMPLRHGSPPPGPSSTAPASMGGGLPRFGGSAFSATSSSAAAGLAALRGLAARKP